MNYQEKITTYHLPVYQNQTLALHRIGDGNGQPILLIHGSVENGKIFYNNKGKGFAWYLAENGYDVFVADLSGKGDSTPPANKNSTQTQTDVILTEFTAYFDQIELLRGKGTPIQIGAHSWGGVLHLAFIARFPSKYNITAGVFFGTKRRISIFTLEKLIKINLLWNWLGRLLSWKDGFLDAKKINLGSDNEPRNVYLQVNRWVFSKEWKDELDGFDYSEALKDIVVPPLLFLTGANDKLLGHPIDVKKLIDESYLKNYKFQIVGKSSGFMNDYDHINLLTHKDAANDHFPLVLEFLNQYKKE